MKSNEVIKVVSTHANTSDAIFRRARAMSPRFAAPASQSTAPPTDARFSLTELTCDAHKASTSGARALEVIFIDDAFVFLFTRGVRSSARKPTRVVHDAIMRALRIGGESPFEFRGTVSWKVELERRRRGEKRRAMRRARGVEGCMTVEVRFRDLVGFDYGNHLLFNGRIAVEATKATMRTFESVSDALRFHAEDLRRRRGDLSSATVGIRTVGFDSTNDDGYGIRKRQRAGPSTGKRRNRDEDENEDALDVTEEISSNIKSEVAERAEEHTEEGEGRSITGVDGGVQPPMRVVELHNKTIVATFVDVHLQPALQAVVEPHERLLRLFETGLPLWAIMCPQYGVPYRPIFRRALKFVSFSLILLSCVSGLIELHRAMPAVVPDFHLDDIADPHDPAVRAGFLAGSVYAQSLILAPFYTTIRVFITSSARVLGVVVFPLLRFIAAVFTGGRAMSSTSASFLAVWRLIARAAHGMLSLVIFVVDRAIAHRKSLALRVGVPAPRPQFVSPMRNREAYEHNVISRIEAFESDEEDDEDDIASKKRD